MASLSETEIERTEMGVAHIKIHPIECLHCTFLKWLEIQNDIQAVDLILAAMLDRRVRGDPYWLFVVGPSSSGKTEIFRTLYDLPDAFYLSNLTSRTIISGKSIGDGKQQVRGMFPLLNNHILIIPEMSEVLTKVSGEREGIFSQLRNLYDG
ncbi:MAG: hypothetical protein ACHQ03_07820 [Candidatus Bathyarchaeia archaeon]